jgi:hypothetical protein
MPIAYPRYPLIWHEDSSMDFGTGLPWRMSSEKAIRVQQFFLYLCIWFTSKPVNDSKDDWNSLCTL